MQATWYADDKLRIAKGKLESLREKSRSLQTKYDAAEKEYDAAYKKLQATWYARIAIVDEYNAAKVAYDLAEKEYGIAADKLNAVRGKFNIVNAENKEGEGNVRYSKLWNDLDALYSPWGVSQDLEKTKKNLKVIEDELQDTKKELKFAQAKLKTGFSKLENIFSLLRDLEEDYEIVPVALKVIEDELKSDFIELYGFDEDYDFTYTQNELREAFVALCDSGELQENTSNVNYDLGTQCSELMYVNTKLGAVQVELEEDFANLYSAEALPQDLRKAKAKMWAVQVELEEDFANLYSAEALPQDLRKAKAKMWANFYNLYKPGELTPRKDRTVLKEAQAKLELDLINLYSVQGEKQKVAKAQAKLEASQGKLWNDFYGLYDLNHDLYVWPTDFWYMRSELWHAQDKLWTNLYNASNLECVPENLETITTKLTHIRQKLESAFRDIYYFNRDSEVARAIQKAAFDKLESDLYWLDNMSQDLDPKAIKVGLWASQARLEADFAKLRAVIVNHYSLQTMPENADKAQQALVQAFIHIYSCKGDLYAVTQDLQHAETTLRYTTIDLKEARHSLRTAQAKLEREFAKLEGCYSEGLLDNLNAVKRILEKYFARLKTRYANLYDHYGIPQALENALTSLKEAQAKLDGSRNKLEDARKYYERVVKEAGYE